MSDTWGTVYQMEREKAQGFDAETLLKKNLRLRDALEDLMRCSLAVVGADLQDNRSTDSYDMYQVAREKARKALAGIN